MFYPCLAELGLIDPPIKSEKTGKDLYIDTQGKVQIYDCKTNSFVANYGVIKNLSSEWVSVTFSNGRNLLCTSDHPFETENRGVVYAKDLEKTDIIICQKQPMQIPSAFSYNKEKAWFLGFMLCDGCYDRHIFSSIALTGEDEIEERFINFVNLYYGLDVQVITQSRGNKGNYKDLYVKPVKNEGIKLQNELIGMFGGKKKADRHIPNEVFSWDKESKLNFLAGMIDADGYINSQSNKVQLGSTNKELALQQMLLAQELGMKASMYLNHYKKNDNNLIRYRIEFIPSFELLNCISCNKKVENANIEKIDTINSEKTSTEYCSMIKKEFIKKDDYSYDVTTESEHFSVSGIYSHNCRSFLSPWKDENGDYKWEGRFNQGVVSLNLPQIGIIAAGDEEKFWLLLNERLNLCYEALMCRHHALEGTLTDISPIHWQYGAIARLNKGEKIDKLLHGGYSTISLGYIGLYEVTKLMTGESHTTKKGREFALKVMNRLRKATDTWKEDTGIGFGLYGTPAESLCYRFARIDKEKFGIIEDITDKGYYTNSYHVDVREKIDAFSKLTFESQFQNISSGGAISYVEVPNMRNNLEALEEIVKFIYDNIQYAEFNTKSDYCHVCGFDGEIIVNDKLGWECPQCHNKDHSKMNVTRRTCGYLGENFWNVGKTKEINSRVLHI